MILMDYSCAGNLWAACGKADPVNHTRKFDNMFTGHNSNLDRLQHKLCYSADRLIDASVSAFWISPMFLFVRKFIIRRRSPDCANEQKPMPFRIDIPIPAAHLVGCQSSQGVQVFVVERKNLQTLDLIARPIFEAAPSENVEIYRPVGEARSQLALVWYSGSYNNKKTLTGRQDVSCEKSSCTLSASKCLLSAKDKIAFKKMLSKKPKSQGTEGEEDSEDLLALRDSLLKNKCLKY
jgi:hypothetical protein